MAEADALPERPGDVLVIVDVQEAFVSGGPWSAADMARRVPGIRRLAQAFGPARTILTRYLPPRRKTGSWRTFFEVWPAFASPDLPAWELVPGLRGMGHVVDKTAYSAYTNPQFAPLLRRLGARRMVVCGIETDACVLAMVTDAVDRGMPVVAVEDLMTSADRSAHEGTLAIWRRMEQTRQVVLTSEAGVLAERGARRASFGHKSRGD